MYMMSEVWKKIKIKHKLGEVKIIILKCALERICVQNCRSSLGERMNLLQLPFCLFYTMN
jgi:hypothetical protein